VVAESVITTAVNNDDEEPVSTMMILPKTKAPRIEQGGLTWTDDFFDSQDSSSSSDIVAVFDYDLEMLKKVTDENFLAARCFATACFVGAFFWIFFAGAPVLVLVLSVILLIAVCAWIRHVEKRTVGNVGKHTAVTRMGLLHVNTRPNPNHPVASFALDIPFEDIVSTKRMPHCSGGVLLTLASTDDGVEYITSGDCYFQRSGVPSQIYLALACLKEPVLFMKLLKAMKEKSVPKSSNKLGTELLCRVERILDGGSDHLSDPNVEQSLRELVVEMRVLNNNINMSSSIEQQGVATIV
jgi:hypothetical protein